jgi:hypothetical protein
MRTPLTTLLLVIPVTLSAQSAGADEALRSAHAELIRAHVENLPDLWMSLESADYVSANGGTISFPSLAERRAQRTAYLTSARFTAYRDVREPIVRVSYDGSLGWLIAEVEIAGTLAGPNGSRTPFEEVWAWVELYEKTDEGWKLVGNVSNSR